MEEPKPATISELKNSGIIKIAQKPVANPKEIPSEGPYAVFFVEEDYPGLSPAMWNTVAAKFNFDFKLIMLVGQPSDLPKILQVVRADARIKGGLFGVGFKDEVTRFLDGAKPIVKVSNSANVFVRSETGEISGYNTDAVGFMRSLDEALEKLGRGNCQNKRVLVLGAGGTGSAIAFLLAEKVSDLVILNRTVEKAEELVKNIHTYYKKEVAKAFGEDKISQEIKKADIVVNTTTKGATGPFSDYTAFTPAGGEWTVERNLTESARILTNLPSKPLVCDVILAGRDTPTIALARKFNLPTLDGKPMNLYQAIPAIKLVFRQTLRISNRELEDAMKAAQIKA